MNRIASLPVWSMATPVFGWLVLAGAWMGWADSYLLLVAAALTGSVLAAVHHAEVIAHRVGEPYGTLLLALAITAIEVALIVVLMIVGGPTASALARDTVFAAVMIILNGIIGLCLLVGSIRHGEQRFGLYGVNASLATLAAIVVLTLVLPNYTTSTPGPDYSPAQLGFIAVISLVLYGTFVMVQTVQHRDYFLPHDSTAQAETHAAPPPSWAGWLSVGLLLACLGAVVLLAKALAPTMGSVVAAGGAPPALVGILIAALVLMPEGLAALRAARANRLQTSMNLALGSALASIGLTIPAVAIVSLATGWTLTLGIDLKSTVLLMLSLLVATLSLGTGRTTVLQGMVHLVLFAVYLFTTVVP